MERQKTEINYGNGYINVYLPREDGFDHGDLSAPSPIFTIDSIYKFSDQVLNDRHLFIGKKTIHNTHFDSDDVDSSVLNSGRSSALGEKDSNVKTIKLSLDASQQGRNIRSRRRFNERLSAYVTDNKTYNVKLKSYSKSATAPRNVREVKVEKPKKSLLSPVLRLGNLGRGASVEKALNSDSLELPPLQSSRTSLTRQKSYFGKEDTFWFPSSALRGIEPKQNKQGNMTARPSSRQFNIWRQSTELLLDGQIDRFSPARMSWPNHIHNDTMITQKTFV